MNKVYIVHVGDEQLTPAKMKELFYNKYPQRKKDFYGPRFTRRAYFDPKHANHMLKELEQKYGKHAGFSVVEYIENAK